MSEARRLAAILAADVGGYSRLMGTDEEGTRERLRRCAASLSIQSLPQPILAHELVDPREFTLIIRNDPISECDGLSGDQQVVAANRCAGVFEPSADLAVNRIGGGPGGGGGQRAEAPPHPAWQRPVPSFLYPPNPLSHRPKYASLHGPPP